MAEQSTAMRQEIGEQADAVARTLDRTLERRPELRQLAHGSRQVVFVARGSSDNAAVYGRYLLETHAGIPAALAAPSVATHYRSRLDLTGALVVSVSQSGATDEIVQTQAWARANGARTVAVTNDEHSPLAQNADLVLPTQAGVERAVPATKTYTAQLAAMAVLGTALAPMPEELDGSLALVPAQIQRLVDAADGVEEAVDLLAGAADTIVTGRGLVYGTALEVALKLEETCLQPVRGLSYADLRHGPIAVVDEDVVAVLVAAGEGPILPAMVELAADLAHRGAKTLVLGGDAVLADACDGHLRGPDLPEALTPIALVVPAQLMVEALARRLGLDPDAPRGLSKVTQTDIAG